MSCHRRIACLALLGTFALAFVAGADDPKAKAPAADDKQVVDSKAASRAPASSVHFRKELNLPFASLSTLGSRIDAARRAPDPVALAHAASELSVAEKVSGKKASLTSTALLKESAELAKLRRQAAELAAVQKVTEQIANEQEWIADMKKTIAAAQEATKADQAAFQRNEQPTFATRTVLVNNYTPQLLTIFVNGFYQAEVGPGLSKTLVLEHRYNPIVLKADGNDEFSTWGPRYIWGQFKTYTWNIN